MSKVGDFLTGLILGAAAGYMYALLNAPRTGEETRAMLEEKSREIRTRAQETVQTTVDKTGRLVNEGRGKAEETLETTLNRARVQVDELKNRGATVIDEKRAQVSETLRRTADQVDPQAAGSTAEE